MTTVESVSPPVTKEKEKAKNPDLLTSIWFWSLLAVNVVNFIRIHLYRRATGRNNPKRS